MALNSCFVSGVRIKARNLIFSSHFQSRPLYPDKGTKYPLPNKAQQAKKKAEVAEKTHSDSQLPGRETSVSIETHGTHENSNWGERSIRSFTVVYMSICIHILTIYITLYMYHIQFLILCKLELRQTRQ